VKRGNPDSPVILPDFCQPTAVLMLVLLGLLLSLLLTLAGAPTFDGFWITLGLTAMMVECVVLASSLLLCSGRKWLMRLSAPVAVGAIFGVIQIITVAFSLLALTLFPALLASSSDVEAWGWVVRNLMISLIASLVFVRYLALYRQWQLQVRSEANARLDALQARIRPHFLFNSLNTVASLIRTRPAEAEESLLDLSDLLRTGLRPGASHALADELELVRGYLRIESQRLGDRLQVDWRIADDLPLDQQIPALLIQPLVENALVHGIARRPGGGTLRIEAGALGRGRMRIRIENPMADPDDRRLDEDGNRMALVNISQRLELAYGDRARLATRVENGQFIAETTLPIEGR